MTLKEKFLPKMYCFLGSGMLSNIYDKNVAETNAAECEKIADDFAIGFAEWFWEHHEAFYSGERDYYLEFKELLEIYKKK